MRILFCQGGERWKIDDCGKAYTSGSFDERGNVTTAGYCQRNIIFLTKRNIIGFH